MYKLDLPIDLKEAAAIEKRRAREQERQGRIFNAKTRQIGIDLQAIKQQVKEKEERDDLEQRREKAFAADAIRNDKIACLLQSRQEADIRELNKALNEFRSLHQQPCSRREWDLYDPDHLKKDKPARVCDDDPRCTISGMQKFDGEDLNNKARTNYQKEQSREWFEKQAKDRKRADDAQKEADRLYDLKRRELDERACELARAEDDCRRAINMATRNYNEALKRERDEKERLAKQQTEDDNATEVANAIYSDMLTENPAVATSAFGPHRVVPDRWKGMTPSQVEDIKRTQEIQRKEKDREQQEEKLRDQEWDRQRATQARIGLLMEREVDRQRRKLNEDLAGDNIKLAKEQKDFQSFLDREVYTNPPTAAYFMQFNTTSR